MRTSAGALVQAHEHQARECGRGLGLLHGVFDDPINKLSDLPWAALVNGLGLLYARAPARERMHITRVRQRPQRRTLVAVQQCSSGVCSSGMQTARTLVAVQQCSSGVCSSGMQTPRAVKTATSKSPDPIAAHPGDVHQLV